MKNLKISDELHLRLKVAIAPLSNRKLGEFAEELMKAELCRREGRKKRS